MEKSQLRMCLSLLFMFAHLWHCSCGELLLTGSSHQGVIQICLGVLDKVSKIKGIMMISNFLFTPYYGLNESLGHCQEVIFNTWISFSKDRRILEIGKQQQSSSYPGLSLSWCLLLPGEGILSQQSEPTDKSSDLSPVLHTSSTRLPFRAKVPSETKKEICFTALKRIVQN